MKMYFRNDFKITVLIIFSALLLLILVIQNIHFRDELKEQQTKISILQSTLSKNQVELDLLYNNEATFIDKNTEKYNFTTFGIYSPMFINKNVEIMRYSYKGSDITKKILIITSDKTPQVNYYATVHQFTKTENGNHYLTLDTTSMDRGTNITMESTDVINAKKSAPYINSHGARISYVPFDQNPLESASIIVETNTSPLGKAKFIEVDFAYKDEFKGGKFLSNFKAENRLITQEMKKIADTMSSRVYN